MLGPITIASSQSLAASFNSDSTVVSNEDVVSYQINITTSNSTGTFYLQGSNDNSNWVTIGTAGTAAAANDSIIVDFDDISMKYVRISYASTIAGTGTCDILLMARSIGA